MLVSASPSSSSFEAASCGVETPWCVVARGYTRSGQGNPDEARAARYVLKDYVNAKLLYCHPPPGIAESAFNQLTHELALERFADKKRAPVTRVGKGADTFVASDFLPPSTPGLEGQPAPAPQSAKSRALDRSFFESNASNALSSRAFIQGSGALDGQAFTRMRVYPHQNSVADDGTVVSGRRARLASVLANQGGGIGEGKGKKHKKMKRVKQRSGKGYD